MCANPASGPLVREQEEEVPDFLGLDVGCVNMNSLNETCKRRERMKTFMKGKTNMLAVGDTLEKT